MKFSGWIFMIISWGVILLVTVFCFYRIFSKKEVKPPRDKLRGFPNNEKGETSLKPDKPAFVPTIVGTSARLASPFIPAINRGAFWRRRVK